MVLSGSKHESAAHLAATGPQVSVFYTFREKAHEPDSPLASPKAAEPARASSPARGITPEARHVAAEAGSSPPAREPQRGPSAAPASPAAGGAASAPELVRRFKLTIDIRSIKAFKALPVNLASVFVQAFLPPEVKGEPTGSLC